MFFLQSNQIQKSKSELLSFLRFRQTQANCRLVVDLAQFQCFMLEQLNEYWVI